MGDMLTSMVHAGNTGDVIAALPAIKKFYEKYKVKPILYLIKDHPAKYIEGTTHPVKNDNGDFVSLNAEMIRLLIPLIKNQDYIGDCLELDISEVVFAKHYAETKDGKRHINLSFIRDVDCNIPYGDIRRWYFYPYPDLTCDLSKQYLHVDDIEDESVKDKIVICRTERYNNHLIDYSFLKEYQDDLVFIGTTREWNNFCMNFDLEIRKVNVTDFYQLAQLLKLSKGLISNQTMIFQIAEGLKIPRAVEICRYAPNVIPVGENAFDYLDTMALQVHFHTMNGTYEKFVADILAKKEAGELPAYEAVSNDTTNQ